MPTRKYHAIQINMSYCLFSVFKIAMVVPVLQSLKLNYYITGTYIRRYLIGHQTHVVVSLPKVFENKLSNLTK